jgi:predicted nucleotidyltransferase component of viral defense system
MGTTAPITTDELIEARMDETGLTREQLLLVVAKSALVRHLATGPDKDRFVLKGGTLLAHTYKSPRQSVRDADYTYIEPTLPTVDDLIEMLRVPGTNGFHLDPAEARWTTGADIYEAKGMKFSIEDITVVPRSRGRGRGNALDISVSVRSGECLDGPIPLIYTDTMLAGEHRFTVMGLSLEELAAEKVLGWASKDQSRHYIDLAYIARDYREVLDGEKAATLICGKFEREKSSGRYRNIRTVSQLADAFSASARIKLIRDSWTDDLGTQILFLPEEADRTEGSLTDFTNVERYVNEVWVPILREASQRRHRR